MELIIVFKKENPGQFVRAQCCMSDSKRNPWKGNRKILCLYRKTGSYINLLWFGSIVSNGVSLVRREQSLTPLRRESVPDPRKQAAVACGVQFHYSQTKSLKREHFLYSACEVLSGLAAWFFSSCFTSPICPVGGRVHFITYYVCLPLGTDFPPVISLRGETGLSVLLSMV